MRPLDVREWLEQERLSGLPHAEFAAQALEVMDGDDRMLLQVEQATGDVVRHSDQIVEAFRVRAAVLAALYAAEAIDENVSADQVGGLLRMFLPEMERV